jgi:hypothetical protein
MFNTPKEATYSKTLNNRTNLNSSSQSSFGQQTINSGLPRESFTQSKNVSNNTLNGNNLKSNQLVNRRNVHFEKDPHTDMQDKINRLKRDQQASQDYMDQYISQYETMKSGKIMMNTANTKYNNDEKFDRSTMRHNNQNKNRVEQGEVEKYTRMLSSRPKRYETTMKPGQVQVDSEYDDEASRETYQIKKLMAQQNQINKMEEFATHGGKMQTSATQQMSGLNGYRSTKQKPFTGMISKRSELTREEYQPARLNKSTTSLFNKKTTTTFRPEGNGNGNGPEGYQCADANDSIYTIFNKPMDTCDTSVSGRPRIYDSTTLRVSDNVQSPAGLQMSRAVSDNIFRQMNELNGARIAAYNRITNPTLVNLLQNDKSSYFYANPDSPFGIYGGPIPNQDTCPQHSSRISLSGNNNPDYYTAPPHSQQKNETYISPIKRNRGVNNGGTSVGTSGVNSVGTGVGTSVGTGIKENFISTPTTSSSTSTTKKRPLPVRFQTEDRSFVKPSTVENFQAPSTGIKLKNKVFTKTTGFTQL